MIKTTYLQQLEGSRSISLMKFTRKTFKYFDDANSNINNPSWFEKNKSNYEDNVKQPLIHLVENMKENLGRDFRKIRFSTRSIVNPKVAKNRVQEQGCVKDYTRVSFSQKRSSLFEWNPGFYIQFGSKDVETYFAGGLYMVSGRQMNALREAFCEDHASIKKILKNKKFKNSWGTIEGELYKRLPKGFEPNHPAKDLLMMKQFYFSKHPNRKEMVSADFLESIVKDFVNSKELLKWIINAVGTYRPNQEKF